MASDTNTKKTTTNSESRWLRGAPGFSDLPEFGRVMDLYWGGPERRISGLTLRIISVNAVALLILMIGILYLGQYQNGLIETKLESFENRVKIISDALAEGAGENDTTTLRTQTVKGLITRIGTRTQHNITVFGANGDYMISTSDLGAQAVAYPPAKQELSSIRVLKNTAAFVLNLVPDTRHLPPYPLVEDSHARVYPDGKEALNGQISLSAWQDSNEKIILSAAAPIVKNNKRYGVVLVRRVADDIEDGIAQVWIDVLKIFLGTLLITTLLSIYLSGVIAGPLRRLARAAEAVRTGRSKGSDIPNFSDRHDEIGELSLALRAMTQALWARMDSIESFAADVAHELKNPLTSLKSAIETLEKVTKKSDQKKLRDIIRHDLERMDRLITDISNASRLDAEMSREAFSRVDIQPMLENLIKSYDGPLSRAKTQCENTGENQDYCIQTPQDITITLKTQTHGPFHVMGLETRLHQVVRNILDNALSFSPTNGNVTVTLAKQDQNITIYIEDSGPGIPETKLGNVFDRFYSERPLSEDFGNNSGLGLSIAKQIIEAHSGTIHAENNPNQGARFIITIKAV